MSFTNLPLWGIGAGLAALAAGLFVLQMLRVRHRQIEVPTTMFWREAVEESRARILRQRFRHPWAYALLLLIAALLWLALAGLTSSSENKPNYLLVLDGSVGMTHPERFDHALELLLADAEGIPAANREVWWSGAQSQLLLAKGEHAVLLQDRLTKLQPENAASAVEQRLLQLAFGVDRSRPLQVRVYGDAPISQATLDLLPDNLELRRCTSLAPAQPGNRGFLAGGISEAASGRWDCIDLYLEVHGTTQAPSIFSQGKDLELRGTSEATTHGARWRFFDLPARGQQIHLSLPGTDAYSADDQLTLALPQRAPLRVLITPDLVPMFGPLVTADSACVIALDQADLVIRHQGEVLGVDLPALELSSVYTGGIAFSVTDNSELSAEQLLHSVHRQLGLAQIDALGLAQQLQQPISLAVGFGERRKVKIWDRVLQPLTGFTASSSYPVFIGRTLRWLANSQDFPPYANTGQVIPHTSGTWTMPPAASLAGQTAEIPIAIPAVFAITADLNLLAAQAGVYTEQSGAQLAVNTFDPVASTGLAASADAEAAAPVSSPGLPAWSWLVLLALALLAAEWVLFQTGRIP